MRNHSHCRSVIALNLDLRLPRLRNNDDRGRPVVIGFFPFESLIEDWDMAIDQIIVVIFQFICGIGELDYCSYFIFR